VTGPPDPRRDVDFTVDESNRRRGIAEDADEDLAPPPSTWRSWFASGQRRTLAGAAVLLVAVGLVARALGEHDSETPGSPASSAATSAGSPTRSGPAGPTPNGQPRVTGPLARPLPPQFRPAGCPADADTCATTSGLPDAALDALLRTFPHAMLVTGVSLLAQRPGRFGPDLVSRVFRARAGSTEVSVYISKPTSTNNVSTSSRQYGKTETTTSLRQLVPGYVVQVDVTQPAANLPVAMDYLVQLANDDALESPQ
jgi:hypothetical protein